jgi:hypothetical protein
MTLLAPGWLFMGAVAALALVALHLLAVGRPAPMVLPTARFVPARTARARRLARRPADLPLLLVRVAAVLLGALALAQPVRTPTRRAIARVIVADRSRAVRDAGEVRDSVRALAGAGDLVIAFDTVTTPAVTLDASPAARDSALGNLSGSSAVVPVAGSLSAALAAARRAVPVLRDAADSIELVIVSPVTTREVDPATLGVRGAWSGRVRVVRVAAAPNDTTRPTVRVVARRGGVADDAMASAVAGVASTIATTVRVVRDGMTAGDAAWARDSAGVVVDWPIDGAPARWAARAATDTSGGIVASIDARPVAFVAALPRRATAPNDGRVVARWADGEPAAIERATGRGCVREVGVTVPQVGDVALRAPFGAFLAALTGPCHAANAGALLDDAAVRRLAGSGPLLAARTLVAAESRRDPLARWLLAGAILLLLLELPLRRFGRPAEAVPNELAEPASVARGEAA